MEIDELVKENGEKVNAVYANGAMHNVKTTQDWGDEYICISAYHLSVMTVCSRLLYSYEGLIGII